MRKTCVNELGVIALPESYLSALSLKPKDYVDISFEKDKIILKKFLPECKICREKDVIEGFEICKKCAEKIHRKYVKEKENEKES